MIFTTAPSFARIAATVSANFRPGAHYPAESRFSNPARGRQSVFSAAADPPTEVVAVKPSERAASVAFSPSTHQHSPGRCQ